MTHWTKVFEGDVGLRSMHVYSGENGLYRIAMFKQHHQWLIHVHCGLGLEETMSNLMQEGFFTPKEARFIAEKITRH